MVSVKRVAVLLFAAAMLIFGSLPALAADLAVKENKTRAGILNVTVPYISGAVGGKQVDLAVNRELFSVVNAELMDLLTEAEAQSFRNTHTTEPDLADVIRYNSELVKYADKMIAERSDSGRSSASWYARSEYEVKSAKNTFFSVVLKIRTYTGGASDKVTWKALNFDLRDGRILELKDLFEKDVDYATRLQTLIGYQQQGRIRLVRYIKGKNVADPVPVTITGQENFYVDDHYNLGLIIYSFAPKKKAEPAVTEEKPSEKADAGSKSAANEELFGTTGAETATKETQGSTSGAEAAEVENKTNPAGSEKASVPISGQNAGSVNIEVYDISLNDFADLIKL